MKKLLCVIMAALMLMGTAFAEEEFTLHNGVKFGMDKDEVKRQESANGFEIGKDNYGEGIIAGYYGAVYYRFDLSWHGDDLVNGVRKCQYRFFDSDTNRYSTLSRGLTDKYGSPMRSNTDSTFFPVEDELHTNVLCVGDLEKTGLLDLSLEVPLTGKSVENKVYEYNRDTDMTIYRFTFKCPTYEQWLLPQTSGGAVLIDHCLLAEYYQMIEKKTGEAMGDLHRRDWEFITYTLLTDQEVETITANANAINDDL